MKLKTIYIIICLAFAVTAQSFFPYQKEDKLRYQLNELYHILNTSFSIKDTTYPFELISDSLSYQGIVYYKFSNNYYSYDSSSQKLFLYNNNNTYPAADFNLTTGINKVLFWGGISREWTSMGRQIKNVLGKDRWVYSMWSDTTYNRPGTGSIQEQWVVEFADELGLVYSYYKKLVIGGSMDELWEETKKLLAGSINGNDFNIKYNIALTTPVQNRPINSFPYHLGLYIAPYYKELIFNISADFKIFRYDSLIISKNFVFNRTTFTALIDFNQNQIQAGDNVKFKIIIEDTTILFRVTTAPDSGWFEYQITSPTAIIENEGNIPLTCRLYQNYPNPFNPTTTIQYAVTSTQHVQLKVYDVLGNEVAVLVNEEKSPGNYKVEFNASKLSGSVYFYKLTGGTSIETKKLIVIK